MYFYKLPIVLLYQQKNKIKTLSFMDENENERKYKYHIYIKVKSKIQFLLHISHNKQGKSLRFYNKNQKDELLEEISVLSLHDYFIDPIL